MGDRDKKGARKIIYKRLTHDLNCCLACRLESGFNYIRPGKKDGFMKLVHPRCYGNLRDALSVLKPGLN